MATALREKPTTADVMAQRKILADTWLEKERDRLFALIEDRVNALTNGDPEEMNRSISSIKAQGQTVKLAQSVVKGFDGTQLSLDDGMPDEDE